MLTVDGVHLALGLDPADTSDHAWLTACVDAVNSYIPTLPVIADRTQSADPWPAAVTLGATMLAVHLYQSRGSPYGRAALDAAGAYGTAYADPEISRLLQLRRWARPSVSGSA